MLNQKVAPSSADNLVGAIFTLFMASIVHIQVGQCGNQLGTKFWGEASDEHGIGPTGFYFGDSDMQLEKIGTYFNQSMNGRYVPRAVLVDLEPSTLDFIRGGLYGQLFRPDNFAYGNPGAGNNWATGYYTEGQEIANSIMDVVRREAETCDVLHAFQLVHSLGGGTGSGLGTHLLNKLRDEFPERIQTMYSVFPSPGMSDTVVEAYNATLSVHQMVECADAVFWLENEALYRICERSLKIPSPTYGDLNTLVSHLMTGTTCSLRFPGQLNADLRKLVVNLVPFPRLHFFNCSFAPVVSRGSAPYAAQTVRELVRELFHPKSTMSTCNPKRGVYLTASAHFRGTVSSHDVEEQTAWVQHRHASYFVEWIPCNIQSSLCEVPPRGLKMAATHVSNTTAIREQLTTIDGKFSRMYARRSFIHWYVNEGLETVEFDEARSNMTDLIQEYEMYETAGVGEWSDNEDDYAGDDV
jgi:tubulin beta